MTIRSATENDLPGILDLYSQPDMDDGAVLSVEDAKTIFTRMASYPDYTVFVAEADGCIVATFALMVMDNLAHMGSKSAIIEDVVVAQSFQNRGIGKQMMEYAMEICRAKACYKVSLSSNLKRSNAHRFYEGLGFTVHGYSYLTEL